MARKIPLRSPPISSPAILADLDVVWDQPGETEAGDNSEPRTVPEALLTGDQDRNISETESRFDSNRGTGGIDFNLRFRREGDLFRVARLPDPSPEPACLADRSRLNWIVMPQFVLVPLVALLLKRIDRPEVDRVRLCDDRDRQLDRCRTDPMTGRE